MPSEPNLQPQQQQSQPEAKTEPQTIRPATLQLVAIHHLRRYLPYQQISFNHFINY